MPERESAQEEVSSRKANTMMGFLRDIDRTISGSLLRSRTSAGCRFHPLDVIRDWGLNYNLGSVVMYTVKAAKKQDAGEELVKALRYLIRELEAQGYEIDYRTGSGGES